VIDTGILRKELERRERVDAWMVALMIYQELPEGHALKHLAWLLYFSMGHYNDVVGLIEYLERMQTDAAPGE